MPRVQSSVKSDLPRLILSEEKTLDKPPTYSNSRLNEYKDCTESYRLKYMEGMRTPPSEATITGNLCHDALELYFGQGVLESPLQYLEVYLHDFLKDLLFNSNQPSRDVKLLAERLLIYGRDCLSLYIRSSESYQGAEPIRTTRGKVATAPASTNGWKSSRQELCLDQEGQYVDQEAIRLNSTLSELSLSSAVAEAFSILYFLDYSPTELVETISVEMPLSSWDFNTQILTNGVKLFPSYVGESEMYLNGFIDWLGIVTVNGEEGLAIVDYKTSKEAKSGPYITFNQQLNLYAKAVETLYEKPVFIGIWNLRTNHLALEKVDSKAQDAVLRNTLNLHHTIKHNLFQKHIPDSKYAKCLNRFNKPCPFLRNCWPEIYQHLNPDTSDVPNVDPRLLELVG